MKQLNRWQSATFLVGGALMVVGAGCFVTGFMQHVACWVFLVGAVMFTLMQSMQTYEGRNIAIRRLRRIMSLANILFLLSGILMVDTVYHFLLPLFRNSSGDGYYNYIQFVYNKWVVLLLVAAILEVYTTHRISSELQKEA